MEIAELTIEFANAKSGVDSHDSRVDPMRSLPEPLGRSLALPTVPLPAVVVGKLIAFADDGSTAVVSMPGSSNSPGRSKARSVVELHDDHLGSSVVLAFEDGDQRRPIIMGLVRGRATASSDQRAVSMQLRVDHDRLTITATEQLVLRCGKASLSMTKEGKVIVYGTYISSRSGGVHRIKGGSVEIN